MPTLNLLTEEKEILQSINLVAQQLGYKVYAIGGFVRDILLHRPVKDIDIVTEGDGVALAEAWHKHESKTHSFTFFKTFGTAQVKYNDWEIEFVGARKESYESNSRKPLVTKGTIHDDFLRRDFTINALAIDIADPDYHVIDLFSGLNDLEKKLIRTPTNPDITFSDDPLRIIRAIRFSSQLQFSIVEETKQAINNNIHRLQIISMERISDELNKIMLSFEPSIGFYLLDELEILPTILPELSMLKGAEVKNGIGHKDNFIHTLQVLDNVALQSNNLWLRWAALLHDIAKPPTKRFEEGIGWTFHGHEVIGSHWVQKIFKRLKLPLNEKMKMVELLVLLHLRPIALTKETVTDAAIRRLIYDAKDYLDELLILCAADITSKNEAKVKKYLKNLEIVKLKIIEVEARDHIRNFQPVVDGIEIMKMFNLSPGPKVGNLKNALKDAILDNEIPNELEACTQFLYKKFAEL